MEPAGALGVTVAQLHDLPSSEQVSPLSSAPAPPRLGTAAFSLFPSPRPSARDTFHGARECRGDRVAARQPDGGALAWGQAVRISAPCPARCPARSHSWARAYVAECERVPLGGPLPASRPRAQLLTVCLTGPGPRSRWTSHLFTKILGRRSQTALLGASPAPQAGALPCPRRSRSSPRGARRESVPRLLFTVRPPSAERAARVCCALRGPCSLTRAWSLQGSMGSGLYREASGLRFSFIGS